MRLQGMGLLFALALAPAHAAEPAAAGTPAAKPRMVCASERSTGSHIRRRTCMTEAQQEERRKRDQEALERMKGPVQPNNASTR